MTKQQHIHKWKGAKYKNGKRYLFCATPDCNSTTAPELTLGKLSICWRCGNPFVMTPLLRYQNRKFFEDSFELFAIALFLLGIVAVFSALGM